MKRNIITSITFFKKRILITAIEKLPSNTVEIFNDEADIDKAVIFIKSSIFHIEKIIGGKISHVNFVLEPSKKTNQKIYLKKESIKIAGDNVSKIDIDNLINIIKSKNTSEKNKVILIQPLKYEVIGLMSKSYSKAPIHKSGDELSIICSITTISSEVKEYLYQVAKLSGVEISQILLNNQTNIYSKISKSALEKGSVSIDISKNQVSVSIIKHNAIIDWISLYDYGEKHLIKGIMSSFKTNKINATRLLKAHSSMNNKTKRVIYSSQIGVEESTFTNVDLENILKQYFNKMIALINKFLSQKQMNNLPIVISGNLNKISFLNNYLEENLKSKNITMYKPLTFIEINSQNTNALGVMNFIEVMDKVFYNQNDTIVNTNPNSISSLKKQEKNIFAKIFNKIGGNYEWN